MPKDEGVSRSDFHRLLRRAAQPTEAERPAEGDARSAGVPCALLRLADAVPMAAQNADRFRLALYPARDLL